MTVLNRFTRGAREVVEGATDVAREAGAPTVEAEHLLLAVTRSSGPVAGILRDAGLDHGGLTRALAAETERSLAAVGVSGHAPRFTPFPSRPHFATSSKLALERTVRITAGRREREISPAHVVLGVLRANVGTVPRALEGAGVDRAALAASVEAVL